MTMDWLQDLLQDAWEGIRDQFGSGSVGSATQPCQSSNLPVPKRGIEAFKCDANGNILARKIGGPIPTEHLGAPGERFSVQRYELELQDGSTIEAFKSLGRYDAAVGGIVPDARMDTDCHGATFARGEYWINDGEVDRLLTGGGFSRTDTPRLGDALIYRDRNNNVVHSVTVSAIDPAGNVTQVTGLGGLETREHSDPPDRAWFDPSAIREVWTK